MIFTGWCSSVLRPCWSPARIWIGATNVAIHKHGQIARKSDREGGKHDVKRHREGELRPGENYRIPALEHCGHPSLGGGFYHAHDRDGIGAASRHANGSTARFTPFPSGRGAESGHAEHDGYQRGQAFNWMISPETAGLASPFAGSGPAAGCSA